MNFPKCISIEASKISFNFIGPMNLSKHKKNREKKNVQGISDSLEKEVK